MLLDDEEIQLGTLRNPAANISAPSSVGGWLSVGESRRSEISDKQARDIHAKLLTRDTVIIVAKTDSSLMSKEPNVDEVLGMTIIFKNVLIVIADRSEMGSSVDADDTRVKPTSFESYGEKP